jgi:hypothetical protein
MSRARDIASNQKTSYSNTEPSSPRTGDVWFDITDPNAPAIKVYNGTTWLAASSAGGGDFSSFLFSGA